MKSFIVMSQAAVVLSFLRLQGFVENEWVIALRNYFFSKKELQCIRKNFLLHGQLCGSYLLKEVHTRTMTAFNQKKVLHPKLKTSMTESEILNVTRINPS